MTITTTDNKKYYLNWSTVTCVCLIDCVCACPINNTK